MQVLQDRVQDVQPNLNKIADDRIDVAVGVMGNFELRIDGLPFGVQFRVAGLEKLAEDRRGDNHLLLHAEIVPGPYQVDAQLDQARPGNVHPGDEAIQIGVHEVLVRNQVFQNLHHPPQVPGEFEQGGRHAAHDRVLPAIFGEDLASAVIAVLPGEIGQGEIGSDL